MWAALGNKCRNVLLTFEINNNWVTGPRLAMCRIRESLLVIKKGQQTDSSATNFKIRQSSALLLPWNDLRTVIISTFCSEAK